MSAVARFPAAKNVIGRSGSSFQTRHKPSPRWIGMTWEYNLPTIAKRFDHDQATKLGE